MSNDWSFIQDYKFIPIYIGDKIDYVQRYLTLDYATHHQNQMFLWSCFVLTMIVANCAYFLYKFLAVFWAPAIAR